MKNTLLLISIAMASTGFAQKVNNKLSFQKGQKYEVVAQTDKTSTVEVMGQSMETKVNSTISEVLDVTDAGKDGATIEHKVKRIQFTVTNPMQSQSFDSEKDTDRNNEIGKMLDKTLKNKYTMSVDATGKITAVKVDNNNPNDKSTGADMGDLISSQLGMNLGVPKVGASSSFKILPDKTVGLGDSWTDTSSADGQKIKTVYTVKNITDKDILLDYTQEINVDTKQEVMGQEAIIKANSKSTGTVTLDRATGLLKQKTAAMEEEGTMEAQGQSIPVKGKTNVTIRVQPAG